MIEVLRDEWTAERELSNAVASIEEAIVTLRQHRPAEDGGVWLHQIRKLRMARGICRNVKQAITVSDKFAALRRK